MAAFIVSVVALGGWLAWIVNQPPCGPPGTTDLASVDRWAPWAFIFGELGAIALAGLALKRTPLRIAVTVTTVGGLAVLSGALIAFLIAAHNGCFS